MISITDTATPTTLLAATDTNGPAVGTLFTFTWTADAMLADATAMSAEFTTAADMAGNEANPTPTLAMTAMTSPVPVVSNAGADQTFDLPMLVTLDGSLSTSTATAQWDLIEAPAGITVPTAIGTNLSQEYAGLTLPGDYLFRLTIDDGTNVAIDYVTVTLNNSVPSVDAGENLTISGSNPPANFVLDAEAFDANSDADIVSVEWQNGRVSTDGMGGFTVTANAAGNLVIDVNGVLDNGGDVAVIGGSYWFGVVVTDASGAIAWDNVKISVVGPTNGDGTGVVLGPPSAHAGIEQVVSANDTVTLSANESVVPAGGLTGATYSWSLTDPTGVTTNAGTTKEVTFVAALSGTWTAEVTVTDTNNDSDTASVSIYVTDPMVNNSGIRHGSHGHDRHCGSHPALYG